MSEVSRSVDRLWKRAAQVSGCLLILPGLLFSWGGLWWLLLVASDSAQGYVVGIAWLLLELITLGGGGLLLYHAGRSLREKPSKPLRLPPPWALGWGLLLACVAGEVFRWGSPVDALFFPPIFLLAAALPPLAAVAWAMPTSKIRAGGLTWRQFTVLFIGGATVSVGLAVCLEIVLPGLILTLVQGLFPVAQGAWEGLLKELAGDEVSRTLASQGFLLALVQLAVVAPLIEELVKPLIGLPLVRRASHPRQAFLIGAAAGAGFATLENILYAGVGIRAWGGIVTVRALGAAIHPLGAGLVALGWYEFFSSGPGRRCWSRFGMALGLHALWNGGIVVLIALAEANFFGPSPPKVEVLGMAESGVLLALLAVLGAGAWVGMRAVPGSPGRDLAPTTDRAIATWAVVCLIAALSIGLAALNVLGGAG